MWTRSPVSALRSARYNDDVFCGLLSPELCENKVRFGSGFNHYAKAKQREVEMQMEGFTLSLLLRGDHGLRSTSDTSPRGNSSKLTVSNRTLF